jgi:hypothetical protein
MRRRSRCVSTESGRRHRVVPRGGPSEIHSAWIPRNPRSPAPVPLRMVFDETTLPSGFATTGGRRARRGNRLGGGHGLGRSRCPPALRPLLPLDRDPGRGGRGPVSRRAQLGPADGGAPGHVPRDGLRLLRGAPQLEGGLAAAVGTAGHGVRAPGGRGRRDRHGAGTGPEHRGVGHAARGPSAGVGRAPQEGRRGLRQRRHRPARSRDLRGHPDGAAGDGGGRGQAGHRRAPRAAEHAGVSGPLPGGRPAQARERALPRGGQGHDLRDQGAGRHGHRRTPAAAGRLLRRARQRAAVRRPGELRADGLRREGGPAAPRSLGRDPERRARRSGASAPRPCRRCGRSCTAPTAC